MGVETEIRIFIKDARTASVDFFKEHFLINMVNTILY
jgi:hypothetical protein